MQAASGSSVAPRSERGKSKLRAACGNWPSRGTSSGSAREPVHSARRLARSGPNREARLFGGKRVTPPIVSIPTSARRVSDSPSRRRLPAGSASSAASPPGGTTTWRRLRGRPLSAPRSPAAGVGASATVPSGCGVGRDNAVATASTWWAAAQAMPIVSAIAARAWRPRAASVQTAVRASRSSPPKNAAVAVTSRQRHSGRSSGRQVSGATAGVKRRHQRASSRSATRSAAGSSWSIQARSQACLPWSIASRANASASVMPGWIDPAPIPCRSRSPRRTGGSAQPQQSTVTSPRGCRRTTNTGTLRSAGSARSRRCTG